MRYKIDIILVVSILVCFALALFVLDRLGIHYDEVLFANLALGGGEPLFIHRRIGGTVIQVMPYIGALKAQVLLGLVAIIILWSLGRKVKTADARAMVFMMAYGFAVLVYFILTERAKGPHLFVAFPACQCLLAAVIFTQHSRSMRVAMMALLLVMNGVIWHQYLRAMNSGTQRQTWSVGMADLIRRLHELETGYLIAGDWGFQTQFRMLIKPERQFYLDNPGPPIGRSRYQANRPLDDPGPIWR